MIRFLLRASGFVSMAAAFAALVVDGTRSIAGGQLLLYSLGETLAWLGGGRYAALVDALASGIPQRAALALFAAPAWLIAAALGLLLLYAGRSPATGIGFSGRRT